MNRKDYQKPAIEVIQLQQRSHILALSEKAPLEKPSDYEDGGDVLDF